MGFRVCLYLFIFLFLSFARPDATSVPNSPTCDIASSHHLGPPEGGGRGREKILLSPNFPPAASAMCLKYTRFPCPPQAGMGRVPSPHEGDLSRVWCALWGLVTKSGGKILYRHFHPLNVFLSRRSRSRGPRAERQAENKTGYRLEVHPYNIYYWRRMNHFPIYGPLTVQGRWGGRREISFTRRNIYVLLKDVLIDWQRYRQGLPGLLSSLPSDLPGHWSSLQPGCLFPFQPFSSLISTHHQPKGKKGRVQGRRGKKSEKNKKEQTYISRR